MQHYVSKIAEYEMTSLSLEDYEDVPTNAVQVGTYKRSKGLEFKQVFLLRLDLVDLSQPAHTDLARLESQETLRWSIFVAITRARDQIWLGGVATWDSSDLWSKDEPSSARSEA